MQQRRGKSGEPSTEISQYLDLWGKKKIQDKIPRSCQDGETKSGSDRVK